MLASIYDRGNVKEFVATTDNQAQSAHREDDNDEAVI